jgi:uncharacterized protein (UPF0335 family)
MSVAGIDGTKLGEFVKRVERLNDEIKDTNDSKKAVFEEAESAGFDPKIMKQVIRRRKLKQSEREREALLVETYERALAGWDGSPLAGAVSRMARSIRAGEVDIKVGDDPWISEQLAARRSEAAE